MGRPSVKGEDWLHALKCQHTETKAANTVM